jgi:hypothetical protein
MQEYFLDRKYESQAAEGRIFGWNAKNEINNGRCVAIVFLFLVNETADPRLWLKDSVFQ